MSYLRPHCDSFPLEEYVWWVSGGKKDTKWWCAVVQTGERVNQAKVFRAHAVLALKLLANQQEDGDGLMQNIVTNLWEESRKGLTEGLREFIQIDNHRAFRRRTPEGRLGVPFKVRRSKRQGGYPEVTVRESPDELTLRAEEVGMWHCNGEVGSSLGRC